MNKQLNKKISYLTCFMQSGVEHWLKLSTFYPRYLVSIPNDGVSEFVIL